MKKILRNILKWLLRIVLAFLSLIVIVLIAFYAYRGKITDKALDIVNEAQDGEVRLGTMHLRPFINFPDVSLQLKELEYLVGDSLISESDSLPILDLDDLYVSLDVIRLIKGKYKISKVRLGDGQINFTVGKDSISNLERAIGIRFGVSDSQDTTSTDSSNLALDMESLEIKNLTLNYIDVPGETNVSMKINGLQSAFSYYPDQIKADLKMHVELNEAGFEDIILDRPRSISFNSALEYDLINEKIILDKSVMYMRDVFIELDGNIDIAKDNYLDINFKAANEGIELLNFLMQGVLNMDAIEQIGKGRVELEGNVLGSFSNQLPVVNLNFSAEDLGFDVKTIGQSVKDINFSGSATNGNKSDFSDVKLEITDFHAGFPKGELNASILLENLVKPEIELDIKGDADLTLIDEILDSDAIQNMTGSVYLDGLIFGKIDKETGEFFDDGGALVAEMKDVALETSGYTISELNGEFYISESNAGFRNVMMVIDSSDIELNGEIQGILSYFAGFNNGASANISFASKHLYLEKLLKDSSLHLDPLEDIAFSLVAKTDKDQLDKAIKNGEIPNAELGLRHLDIDVPGYNNVGIQLMNLEIADSTFRIKNFIGRVGDSKFRLQASIENYTAFIENDSTKEISLDFKLKSAQMKASDLLTFNGEFKVLPEVYSQEEMLSFIFEGKLETTLSELLSDKAIPNVKFYSDNLHWNFKYYPMEFRDFVINVQTQDSVILVNNFEGAIGESNIRMSATFENILDSTKDISGELKIASELLDFNQLLNYQLANNSEEGIDTKADQEAKETGAERGVSDEIKAGADVMQAEQEAAKNSESSTASKSLGLDKIDYPDFSLDIDIDELRYEGNTLYKLQGKIRSKPYKIIYLDRFAVQSETGGTVLLDGQFNVSDPDLYALSAGFDIDTVNMSDFDVQLAMNDSLYSLEDNFNGILSADGIAELFMNPDMSINVDYSTAMFNLLLKDGRVRNFTPLQAVAKFTGNKDLNDVKFGTLRNSFTLVNGSLLIPLMSIESTLGLILIEGEQALDGSFLYLARVPTKLISGTAWNVIANKQKKEVDEENEVQELTIQKFAKITIWGKGEEMDVKPGDKRDKYR